MNNFVLEVLRDGEENITGWEVRFASNKKKHTLDYEYIVIDGTGFDLATVSVQDDGAGNPELFEDEDKVGALQNESDIDLRIRRMEFGKRLIAIMSIRNDAKSLTVPQIAQFATDFADINTALLNGSIATAGTLINAITPDDVVTFQADKDALLAEITASQADLGY